VHEYSLMENVVESILKQIQTNPLQDGEKVSEIKLQIGALEIHSEDSFRQAFQMIINDTPSLKGASLDLMIEQGHLDCPDCGYKGPCPFEEGDRHDALPVATCPQCQKVIPILGGRGVGALDIITS